MDELAGPPWLAAARRQAFATFSEAGMPTEAEEVWRYSRVEDLDLERFRPMGPAPRAGSVPGGKVEEVTGLLEGGEWAGTAVTRDGSLAEASLPHDAGPDGLSVWGLAGGSGQIDLGPAEIGPDAFSALAAAFLADAVVVDVAPGVVLADPVLVVHWVGSDGAAVFPRTVVRLGEGARARVAEVVVSGDVASLVVPVTRLVVGDHAELSYLGIQELGPATWQLGYQRHSLARGARLTSFVAALGGDYARLRTDSVLEGAGASSDLLAAYFGRRDQVLDFRTQQDHVAPATRSDLFFKGAVADDARSVYTGLIRVRKGAVGTNAFQTNRNLVLSDGAHADSVPNLDIAENDVRCSHASAVGPVDPEQRYYLESRGVPPEVADRLIVLGFFEDILGRLPFAALSEHLRGEIGDRVAAALPGAGGRP
ncbi:MAG: Fe-S cluster assembly protein SufD [Acidimicrobiales bacterium]